MKIWKGRNTESSNQTKSKKIQIMMSLIIVLMLICVIPTIMLIVEKPFERPAETAELNKDVEQKEEQVSAASVAISAGNPYAVEKTGIYKIELHGGKGADAPSGNSNGYNGSKVIGYVKLNEGDILTTERHAGGAKGSSNNTGAGGDGLRLYVRVRDIGLCFWWTSVLVG